MAKIYVSYSQADSPFARDLAEELRRRGHTVAMDVATLTPGSEWRDVLTEELKASDALVAIITPNALRSQFVSSEIGAARAFAQSRGDMLVIPVIAEDMTVPPFIADIMAIVSPDRDVVRVADEVERAVAALIGKKAAREQQAVAEKAQLELDAAPFVEDAMKSLTKNERRERWIAYLWFFAGAAVLGYGVVYSVQALVSATQLGPISSADIAAAWVRFAWSALKTLVVVGLLLAAAKYAFVLGRAHVAEALKNADRIHAISYGRFYLKAYGGREAPPQIKDVFQHWNVASPSAFAATTPEQFDPKYVEHLLELSKIVAGKAAGEK